MATVAQRNLTAECRAIEEGHRTRIDDDRHVLVVVSDSTPSLSYDLFPRDVAGWLSISCTCPAGARRAHPAGVLGCKHAALVARRLERAGLAAFDGYWRVVAR